MIKLLSPENGAKFSVLTDIQREFIRRERPVKALSTADNPSVNDAYPWYSHEIEESQGISFPACFIFKWECSDVLCAPSFEISLSADFTDDTPTGRFATVSDVAFSSYDHTYFVTITNLMVGTVYYWRVSTSAETSETRSFSTFDNELRPIGGGAFGNIRDIGGRINTCGKRIRQGLVFRGGALNALIKSEFYGRSGMHVIRDNLGIKTDIDLRWEAVGKYEFCPLGDHVKYKLFTAGPYHEIVEEGQMELNRQIFEMLADESNYPIYFHCVAGADRTGTIGFLLDGLLGMSDEDIILNYNFTAICSRRSWCDCIYIIDMLNKLNNRFPDTKSLSELFTAYLRSTGLTEETLDRIKNNLLE